MIEQTLSIFKPDLVANSAHVASVFIRLLAIGLLPVRLKRIDLLSMGQVRALYKAHEGQPYYARNYDFMLSGPCVVMILEGERAVERLREIIGSTDPRRAQPGTLRRMFGTELPRNAIHATATAAEVDAEIKIFFDGVSP